MSELLKALKDSFDKLAQERSKDLLKKDLDLENEGTYFLYYDTDDVDIGVGRAIVRCDTIQDEDRALDDAKEEILAEIEAGENYEILDDDNLRSLIVKALRG